MLARLRTTRQMKDYTEALRLRGHSLTRRSTFRTHKLRTEQRDAEAERRFWDQTACFGHPAVTGVKWNLKPLEVHNNHVLRETIAEFQPDLIHVFSLTGLSCPLSLRSTMRSCRWLYDVFDSLALGRSAGRPMAAILECAGPSFGTVQPQGPRNELRTNPPSIPPRPPAR